MAQLMTNDTHNLARAKLTQVFRYLQSLHQLRNPIQREIASQPWLLWLHDLPQHPGVRRGFVTTATVEDGKSLSNITREGTSVGDDFILKVSRPRLTNPPEPPQVIIPWLL
ncbi:MAG TPA: hypothetical protein VF099_04470, partial [Ktedonobacterales bacterium]